MELRFELFRLRHTSIRKGRDIRGCGHRLAVSCGLLLLLTDELDLVLLLSLLQCLEENKSQQGT